MARHLCRFYNKHLNHCQLLQIQQFFSEFYQFFGENEPEYGVTFHLTNERTENEICLVLKQI